MGFLALCSLPIRLDGLEASGGEAEANSAILDESIGGGRILSGFQFQELGVEKMKVKCNSEELS